MQDTQLELFISICDAGSFSRAEASQYISKQAMIKQINNLEEELGVTLLIRNKHGISLTDEGRIFYDGAKSLLQQRNDLYMALLKKAGKDTLRIGNLQHQVLLDPVTSKFMLEYPDIHIQRVVHPNHSGEYRVEHGIQDVAETFLHDQTVEELPFEFQPLCDLPYYALMDRNHPLASYDKVSISDLSSYLTVYFPMMVPQQYIKALNSAFHHKEENLRPSDDVDHQVEIVFSCIHTNHIVIGANPSVMELDGIVKVPLKEKWMRTYGIIYRTHPTPIIRNYINLAKKYYESY